MSSSIPSLHQTPTYEVPSLLRRNAIAGGVALRILPLGDSITYGEGSSSGNGYRLALYNLLHAENEVNYIGRVKSGTMADNANEGYRGYPIVSIADSLTSEYPERPNIVLLMAGTNDVIQGHDVNTSSAALDKLTDMVITANPNATVLVAETTPLLDPKREAGRLAYNSAILGVIKPYADSGKHIAVVDMGRITSKHINQTDGIHPNDEGYELIAYAWYEAIHTADQRGWLGVPKSSLFPSSKALAEWTSASRWTPLEVVVYVVMSLAVVVAVRKVVNMAIRRYRT